MKTQDFLVEIGTEELPPKALRTLGLAFKNGIESGLQELKLGFQGIEWFATPRRLAVLVHQLEDKAADEQQQVLGPPESIAFDQAGQPTKAAQAFAKKNGLAVEQLELIDTSKGRRLVHRRIAAGAQAVEMLPDIIKHSLDQLPIPRRMHWGALKDEFVRPVHWLLMLYGEQVLTTTIMSVTSGSDSRGHRFHKPGPLHIQRASDYCRTLLEQGKVIADFTQRRDTVRKQVEAEAAALGAQAVIDDDLLDEVTALVEWPIAMAGQFEERFLEVPAEALISSMKEHQKYFHVVDQAGVLQPYFIFVANLESRDPRQVILGNEKVIRPRLSDATFFYETDRKHSLESRRQRLKSVVFQSKLGSLWDKSERVAKLARFCAREIGGDADMAERAAQLAKCDLVSEMVFEFSDLQGIAGYYYALNDGENPEVAEAMKEQYLPRFAGDELPASRTGSALALADRIDTLVGIFGINQAPTGSKDPFALRRAALGLIRIIREKRYRTLDVNELIWEANVGYGDLLTNANVQQDVSDFIFDRYRAIYHDEGIETNTVLAVQRVIQGNKRIPHNPYDVALRIEAVEAFRTLADAEALSAANKRVQNILAKQSGDAGIEPVKPELLQLPQEVELNRLVVQMGALIPQLCEQQAYAKALQKLANLRLAVDDFFDHVMVMDKNAALQKNRINLLRELNLLFLRIADISQLQNRGGK